MEISVALETLSDFSQDNLSQKLLTISTDLVRNTNAIIPDYKDVLTAALVVKRFSAQNNEIIHAIGIIQCLRKILDPNELIGSISLASGSAGDGFDLVTNKRIAEFKFSRWQNNSNGSRKRQVFKDLVNLYLSPSNLMKELYVLDSKKVIAFLESQRAKWKNVLSKSGGLNSKLERHLETLNEEIQSVGGIFNLSQVKVFDIENILGFYLDNTNTPV